ncbi:MAG: IS66 family insertion sequence element accessory protein TnpB [Albidovulum sp.]|nr:IS66 family insertion sequence element accessory protein TnpB [Albidovulum sp.]
MPANVPEGGIWLSTRPADMRKSFDGLAALVRNELGGDVVSGGWFVFADRRRTMMKIIGFGPGGCWIWSQRLEQGLFAVPFGPRGAAAPLSRTDLQALLDGVDFAAVRRRKRYARPRVAGPGKISGIR